LAEEQVTALSTAFPVCGGTGAAIKVEVPLEMVSIRPRLLLSELS
jgi:hypothetical protein